MAADGPMPDALALRHALCSGTGRHLLGLPGFNQRQTVSPKSWVWGRKLRISNCSPESQKKENISLPGWYRMNFTCLPGYRFPDEDRNLAEYTFILAGTGWILYICLDAGFQVKTRIWQDMLYTIVMPDRRNKHKVILIKIYLWKEDIIRSWEHFL